MLPIKKIVCPTDFSDPSKAGLDAAVELAGKYGAHIYLVYVLAPLPLVASTYPFPGGRHEIPYSVEDMLKSAKVAMQNFVDNATIPDAIAYTTTVLQGRPADEITRLAEDEKADLITIATHGESGWQRFVFGSVAERVVRLAHCPVLVLKK